MDTCNVEEKLVTGWCVIYAGRKVGVLLKGLAVSTLHIGSLPVNFRV